MPFAPTIFWRRARGAALVIWLRLTVGGSQSRRLEGGAHAAGGLAGNFSCPTEPGAHATMCEINGLTIHQRAASDDTGYAGARALLRGRCRHAPLAKRAVEPNAPDVPGGGLPNDLLCDIGVRGDDEAIQITGYAGKVRIALTPSTSEAFGLTGNTS